MWIFLLIIGLSATSTGTCQTYDLPSNQYGLPVVSTVNQYKKLIKADTAKRMVAVEKYVQPFVADWVYATDSNFTKKKLYRRPNAYIRLEAAKALASVQAELAAKGLGLMFFDAYRPYAVTEEMWKVVPDSRYAANPAKGSGHNRGAAVDVTLIELATKSPLPMPTGFDDFSEKAHHDFADLPREILSNRQLLRTVMEKYGFVALDTEWWHYYLPNSADRFPLMDLSFRQMKRMARKSFR